MRLSPYFNELSSSYAYEIDDLTYDSGGDDVLASRLKVKRNQFAALLPMSEFDPVMVAAAFRGGFRFGEKELSQDIFGQLLSAQPGSFPPWQSLAASVEMEPWAGKLAQLALQSPGGEQFMLITAGLEYIHSGYAAHAGAKEPAPTDVAVDEGESDDDGPGDDLGEAGEEYLSDHGFDRRS